VKYDRDYSFINAIRIKKITNINKAVHYIMMKLKFYNEKEIVVPVPGFVKFYSQNKGNFIAA